MASFLLAGKEIMATKYDFSGPVSGWTVTFDASAAHAMETLRDVDSTTGMSLYIRQVDVAVCPTTGFRILDNSSDINRIISLPATDETTTAGVITHTWDFWRNPVEVAYSDYTRLIVESTIAGQIRGTIQGYSGPSS